MGGDAIGDHSLVDFVLVREAEMFGGGHIAEQAGAIIGGGGGPDTGGDVVIAGCDVGHDRAKDIERGSIAEFLLAFHVGLDLVEGDVSGALDHDLHAFAAAPVDQFRQGVEFGELGGIAGIGQASGTEPVAKRDGDVMLPANLDDLIPMGEEGVVLLADGHPFRHQGAAPADDAHFPFQGHGDVAAQEAGVERHEIHPLLGLFPDDLQKEPRGEVHSVAVEAGDGFVEGNRAEGDGAGLEHSRPDGGQVGAHTKIHDEIGACLERDVEFAEFLAAGGAFCGASEVGVDLCPEGAPGNGGTGHGMGGVGREDGAAGRDFVPDEGGGNLLQTGDGFHDWRDGALPGFNKLSRHATENPFLEKRL